MKTLNHTTHADELAKTLAAEDIRRGDIVAILDVVYEYPSFLWCNDAQVLPPTEPVRIRWRSQHLKKPLKVKAICLPYVLVKTPKGRYGTLDMRQYRLVRLSDRYGQKAWKRFRKAAKRKKKRP